MLLLGGTLSLLISFKCVMDEGLGAKPSISGQFLRFLGKNNHFKVIWIIFGKLLKPLERMKLLRLGIYLKNLHFAAHSAVFVCRSG